MAQNATVGKYLVGRTLGEGKQGKVKLGTDMETNEEVALKFFRYDSGSAEETEMQMQDAQREVSLLLRVNHPNIINVRGAQWNVAYPKKNGTTIEAAMLVLDYAAGGFLFDYLMHTGKFPETLARTFFYQMCDALQHCQSRGISHRDIKPENVFIGGDFSVKLGDFGLARLHEVDNAEGLTTYVGTRAYMAPELLSLKWKRGTYNGEKVDVWAVACVLFILMCGAPPLEKADKGDWYYDKILKKNWRLFWMAHERVAKFSDGVKDIIQKMLESDPAKRLSFKEIMEHPWMKGKTMSAKQIRNEMSRRKRAVDDILAKERMEKLREKGGTATIEEMQQHVFRSVGETTTGTPVDLPVDLRDSWNMLYVEVPGKEAAEAPSIISEMAINAILSSELGGSIDEDASNMTKCRIVANVPSKEEAGAKEAATTGSDVAADAEDVLPPPTPQVQQTAGKGSINVSVQVYNAGADRYAVSVTRRGGDMYSLRRVHDAMREKFELILASEQTHAFASDDKVQAKVAPEEDASEEDETL